MGGKNRTDIVKTLRKNLFLSQSISELLLFMLDKINDIILKIQTNIDPHKKAELLKLSGNMEKLMRLVEAMVLNNINSGRNISPHMEVHLKYLIEKLVIKGLCDGRS